MGYIQIVRRVPEDIRLTMVELMEAMEEDLHKKLAVRRQDFDELRASVRELNESHKAGDGF